jgi:hypothetical protein
MVKKEFRYTTLWKETDDEIVFATYTPKLEVNLEVALELVRNRMEFAENKPHYVLIDFTNVLQVTKEARDFMNTVDGGLKGIKGGAFLSNSVVTNLFVNLFFKINNPPIPSRFFTNKEDALKWLIGVKQSQQSGEPADL